VRHLVALPDASPVGWELLWRDRSGSLWRNPLWLPEVRVVGRSVVGGWDLVTSETVDFASAAVVPAGTPAVAAREAELAIRTRTGSHLEADVVCDGPCLVVVAQPWAPGWTVTVDGREVPVVRTNLAGLGTVVEAGEHRVCFRYRPWRWRSGVP
jgi:hypothetical protein